VKQASLPDPRLARDDQQRRAFAGDMRLHTATLLDTANQRRVPDVVAEGSIARRQQRGGVLTRPVLPVGGAGAWPICPSCGLELLALLRRQRQRVEQKLDCRWSRCVISVALEVADDPRAESRACRERLLGEARRAAGVLHQLAERWVVQHGWLTNRASVSHAPVTASSKLRRLKGAPAAIARVDLHCFSWQL
jgi:hypothetical protein